MRPLLDSAAPVWNTSKKESIYTLEKVQRRALQMISNLGPLHYEERLKALGLESLENRRRRGDLIQCFKTMNGHGSIDPNKWFSFIQDRHEINTRKHAANHIVPEKCRLNVRKDFFVNRVAHTWNDLPSDVKNATSTNSFKNMYDYYIKHG